MSKIHDTDDDDELCDKPPENHLLKDEASKSSPSLDTDVRRSEGSCGAWADTDFSSINSGVIPEELDERKQWMVTPGTEMQPPDKKRPFAPWSDPNTAVECGHADHDTLTTCAECEHDARYKWGDSANYRTGAEADEALDENYRLGGRVFLQQESDPFAFVDGDDVRDPETGNVHPAFIKILNRLGATYADISTSGAGIHAYYQGELPNGMSQAVFQIDDNLWGSNVDPPTVEIYANKHVCVTTGEHVRDTPTNVREWDSDALADVLDQYNALKSETAHVEHDIDRDLANHTPDAIDADETATGPREIVHAVKHLLPADLPLRTQQVGTDATGWEKWDPSTYRASTGNDSLHHPPGEPIFHDFKHNESFGVLSLYAAEQGIITDPWDRLTGSDWWEAVNTARDAGAPIPEYDGDDAEPVAELPLAKLDALTGDERERFARKRGLNIPTTDDARDRLRGAVLRELRAGNTTVLDAPTALGKSHTVATESWRRRAIVTGESPVVHLHPTRDARDDAAETTRSSSATGAVLKSRKERCPVAGGEHDPVENPNAEDAPDQIVTIDGDPASAWFDRQCDGKGLPFSTAHAVARERNDQDLDALPCCESGDCPAVAQWDGLPRTDDGEPAVDVIHATHQFAYVPSAVLNRCKALDFTVSRPA